ncbi:hypothetical protein OPV22_014584 [Ensete ventricosum]|uniref:Disease resistance protein RGA3 n=1 Tax=Ensete ventricosum TaxID=4639 RepID=A0AAV8PKM0_ENSVE|nr:hypothetical protein OPV22_014584 [Ensete ventricosum]
MAIVLCPFVSRLVNTLIDMAEEEMDMVLGVPGEIQKLQRTLRKIQLVLHDAEQRRIEDEAINEWLRELKDVMYDADDVLDECRSAAEKWTPREWTSTRCRFPVVGCFREAKFTHEVGVKVKLLNRRLEEMSAMRSKLDLKVSAERRVVSRVTRKTSHVVESDIVGVGVAEDARGLVELLTKEDLSANVVVHAIVGIGGIGKTTLAQKVFDDDKIKGNFRTTMWVCVSQEFTETDLLRDIVTSAGGSHGGAQSRTLLEPMVEGLLKGNKFLLVLDDVWRAEIWDDLLRNPLRGGAAGSRVLVTTRNQGITKQMKAVHIHRVNLLPPEDCWSLLCRKATTNADEERDAQNLKDIGLKMVEKCQGLPLAVKTIGGVLCTKELSRRAWVEVLRSVAWSQTGLPQGVHGALYLSYEDLPSHLKQCFLYCALFREDYAFDRAYIVQLWIAEGFVHAEGDLTLEATGEEYFRELVRRSLLQSDPHHEYVDWRCTMHDLLRSLGHFLTRDESLVVRDVQKGWANAAPIKLRRLSIVAPDSEEIEPIVSSTKSQESTRTLLLEGARADGKDIDDYLTNLLRLRVLYLAKAKIQILPQHIGNLIHLRYLNLSHSDLKELPDSIRNLKNLQFLLLFGCRALKHIPKGIVKLRNLRTLNLRDAPVDGLPSGMGRLEHLNVLNGLVVNRVGGDAANDSCSLEEVGSLHKLRDLSIYKLERAGIEAETGRTGSRLEGNQNLEYLDLHCSPRPTSDACTEEETERIEKVFDTALRPPSSVHTLRFQNFFGRRYPRWLASTSIGTLLPNIRHLELHNCDRCPRLPPLGKLPGLDFLLIAGAPAVATIGVEFFGSEAQKSKRPSPVLFPKLTRMYLKRMPNLERWRWVAEHEGVAMPRLNKLVVADCPKLESLPEGLSRHATRLTTLHLENVGALKSIRGFPSVRNLWVCGESGLEIVTDLPALEVLQLERWWHVLSLPDWLLGGLPCLTALQRLDIECSNQLLRRFLQKDAKDWSKIEHLPIVYIRDDRHNYVNYIKQSYTLETNLVDDDEDEDVAVEDDDDDD